MRANNVIIVSAGKANYVSGDALDKLIRQIRALKKNPVLVLGPDGDDLMRTCTELEHCEIVFDPNYEGDLFSSVKAGLFASIGAAFVVDLSGKTLDTSKWPELEKASEAGGAELVLRPVSHDSGHGSGTLFPQLITARGVPALKELPAKTGWSDSSAIPAREIEL